MPITSSGLRVWPNRSWSISDSHSRKRGQAKVQSEHPRSPWTHASGPSSWRWTGAAAVQGAERAPSVAVDACVRPVLLELDGDVVLVPEDVERTRHDARGASG